MPFKSPFHLTAYLCIFMLLPAATLGQSQQIVDPSMKTQVHHLSAVTIDGEDLFYVRGVLSYPAELRSKTIQKRICKIAGDPSIDPAIKSNIREDGKVTINIDGEFVMSVFDADGEIEGVDKEELANVYSDKIKQAIINYRHDRSAAVLKISALKAVIGLVILFATLFTFNFLFKRLNEWFRRRMKSKIDKIENASYKLIQSDQMFQAFHLLYKFTRLAIIVFICTAFFNFFLGLFPWSRGISIAVLEAFLNPLQDFGRGFIDYLPSMFVLIIIWVVTKYILKFIRLLFYEVSRGAISINNFDPDWAMPSFKIVRLFLIVFALVLAFPYIPGSDTNAFKGISVFLGIVFSLGSSSFIANIVAGYSLTYQGAFKHGDYIKVNEFAGFVENQSTMVTRLRSTKNEEIVIPNSVLLNSNVINYTLKARQHDLILHTRVGIGYETPWRLVDAMLKEAARRSEGISQSPEPFVLKKELGDFAVTYELNAYCLDESRMNHYYSVLHQNILDVFNENNVAIMTPSYEGDPESPKLVPPGQWDPPLAKKE